jgi:hypothetical protein
MITSEVQRTLVKSPPELWTELSDPDSLARHLGEFGEITITRVEAEKLVEWEAAEATGTVQIKASGWGTKVTLTVNRELPTPVEIDAPGHDEPAEEEPQAEDEAALDARAPLEHDAPRPELDAEAAATASAEDETLGRSRAEASQSEVPKPAPATEAARRAAGWIPAGDLGGPAIESDLRAAEAAAADSGPETAAEILDGPAWDLRTATEPAQRESESQDEASAAEQPAAEPRRGFFARIFGARRRRARQEEPEAPAPESAADPDPQPLPWEAPSAGADGEQPTAAVEPVAESPVIASGERADNVDSERLPSSPPAESAAAEPVGEEARTMPAAIVDPEAEAAEARAEHERSAQADLAAELKAAEETAAEEVTAVLTGVLDRLGAAHHRPFSRS